MLLSKSLATLSPSLDREGGASIIPNSLSSMIDASEGMTTKVSDHQNKRIRTRSNFDSAGLNEKGRVGDRKFV